MAFFQALIRDITELDGAHEQVVHLVSYKQQTLTAKVALAPFHARGTSHK